MKAKDLKNSILQQAVQGKLVAQDPNDEPASVLLERIREERHELIKEGKIKAPKGGESVICRGSDGSHYEKRIDAKGHESESVCIDDEIPFEIPGSWEWTRLDNVGDWGAGATPERGIAEYYEDGTIPWLLTGDLNDGIINDIPHTITELALAKTSVRLNPAGSILVAMYGATIGKLGILGIPATTNQACCACQLYEERIREYLFYFLLAWRDEFRKKGEGGAQPNISKQKIITSLIPIPPLEEQSRIVAKINELMPLVEEYGKLEEEREQLDSELPDRLRKSILQQAVQGKLVPQDPSDEPVSVLLGRIREERHELIKKGEIKAHKGGESVIYRGSDGGYYEKRIDTKGHESEPVCIDDEIPFEIPASWEWARLGSIAEVNSGNTPPKNQIVSNGNIPYFKIADMNSAGNETEMTVTNQYVSSCYTGKIFFAGTIIYPKNGGAVLTNKRRILVKNSVIDLNTGGCRPYYLPTVNFVRIFLEVTDFGKLYKGTAVPTVNANMVKGLFFPLPPLEEQSRIVAKLDELMPLLTSQQ